MTEARPIPAKYVFLDVVGFTRNRTVEAQTEIVARLNEVVLDSVNQLSIPEDHRIFLPTGDGLCIALLELDDPLDVHIQLALEIVRRIQEHHDSAEEPGRRFLIRVGVNANVDNLVTDINGRTNVAGAGINTCQRIMGLADAGQILVGSSVYDVLSRRDKYAGAFRHYRGTVKHGENIDVYQLVTAHPALQTRPPTVFQSAPSKPTKLSPLAAHFLAHAITNEGFAKGIHLTDDDSLIVAYYFRATDSLAKAQATDVEPANTMMPDAAGTTMDQQHQYFAKLGWAVVTEFRSLVVDLHLSPYRDCFLSTTMRDWCFPSPTGRQRLAAEWPGVLDAICGDANARHANPTP